jgi:hypothetical protein
MKKVNIKTLRSFNPCYDPSRYFSEDWNGTALDILDRKDISFEDRLWCLMRTDFVSEKLMRLFAVWCARQVQHLMKDEHSIYALDFMDAYIEHYWIIDDEFWKLGWEQARDAAWDAAGDAARDAAWAAARDAAGDAARDAAGAAAWDAAGDAAGAAAWDAAGAAAWDAAWAAAGDAQEKKFRELIIAGVKTGDTF